MGDLYFHGEPSGIHSLGYCNAVESYSPLSDQYYSFAAMDDIFSRLLSLTSYIRHQFFIFIEDLIFRDACRCTEEDFVFSSSPQDPSSSYHCSVPSPSSRSQNVSRSIEVHRRVASDVNGRLPTSRSECLQKKCAYGSINLIFRGLVLPLYIVRPVWNLTLAAWRCCCSYIRCAHARVKSIISRLRITLHGSSDDIGWMQRTPGMDPVEDGSARFRELLQAVRNGEHKLPDSYVYLLIPGLFSNHGPLYFVSTKRFFSKMGLACHIAKIHSEASVEHNSWVLKQYIEELYWGSGKRVMLFGHSKGGVDAAAALSVYWDDLKDKVAGLALVQSPYGGTPIASDILREGQIADKEARRIMELIVCRLIKGDIRALEDLTYAKRKEFVMNHKLPKNIPLISFHSEASICPSVISTLTHVAHAELPSLPFSRFGSDESEEVMQIARQVPVVAPVSAAMALSALHLQLRYGEKSDGLVTCRDAEVPGSIVVRPDRKLDHAWMVYSSWNKVPTEPDACEMCEALLTMLVEIGEAKTKEMSQGSWKHLSLQGLKPLNTKFPLH